MLRRNARPPQYCRGKKKEKKKEEKEEKKKKKEEKKRKRKGKEKEKKRKKGKRKEKKEKKEVFSASAGARENARKVQKGSDCFAGAAQAHTDILVTGKIYQTLLQVTKFWPLRERWRWRNQTSRPPRTSWRVLDDARSSSSS